MFTAHDQPGARRPGIQVDQPGDLDHLCPVADLAAGFAGGFPVLFLHEQEGVADPAIDPVAEGEADVAHSAFLGEPVGGPGRVGADQQLVDREGGVVTSQVASLPFLGELVDGGGQGDDVVSSAVGPGVARPEHPGQHLAGLGQHRRERMVSVGALVRRGGVLFVGPRCARSWRPDR